MIDLKALPFSDHPWTEATALILVLAVSALFANFVVKRMLLAGVDHLVKNTSFGRDQELRKHGVIPRIANIMPALVISFGVRLAPGIPATLASIIQNVSNAFVILTVAMAIGGILAITDTIYHRRPAGREQSIKGYIQIVKLGIYAVAAVLIIATLTDKSPVILLSGLGAMAAVLILVFQDTLLSLVAGIQINSTDMVRVGDWIEMPELNADGSVIEIALHTVKVRNWDKTITTIPIRKFVTGSFKNWRGMTESGVRRIKRSITLDQNTISFLDASDIERLGHVHLLKDYLASKVDELATWNANLRDAGENASNTRRLTNIGTFRAYMIRYLRQHPMVDTGNTLLVRQLEPGPNGIPIEIYCFSRTTVWADYEDLQSDIFDHVLSILPEFNLTTRQDLGGRDIRELRSITAATSAA